MINLYEYQKRYLADLPARAIMAADTGTGKTFMALAHYANHGRIIDTSFGYKKMRPLLILAPASKVRTQDWEREIAEYFGDNQPEYIIYSYEKFSRNPSTKRMKEGQKPIWHQFSPAHGGKQYAVICDEIHRAKNSQSLTGKAVFAVARGADFFVGLSATPLPNGWIDVANYFKIFGIVKHITHFKKVYCQIVTYKGWPEIVGYNNEEDLARKWQSMSKQLTKAEANDLPDRTFIGVNFKRPKEYVTTLMQRKHPETGELLDSAPALAHALRQTLTAPKLDYLKELLVGTTENVVIFYTYISEREAILKMLKHKDFKQKTTYRQDGEAHELPSKQNWSAVKNSVTIAQYQSGSTGVEMTYATQVVYFSPTYSYGDYIQSIGRVYRNGQTQKTTFYNFRTIPTIEKEIYEALRGKQDFQTKQWLTKLEQKEARNG